MTTLRHDAMNDMEAGLPRLDIEALPGGEARYARLAEIVKSHAFATFAYDNEDGCLMMDVQTARLLVRVADALNEKNRDRFLRLDLGEMVDVAWKLVG